MRCIFCLMEQPSSVEHVFPEAIGGTLTINRVCKGCNDRLGNEVDVRLTDHPLILLRRSQLGMRDATGKEINPWAKVFGIGTMASDPTQRIQIVPDASTGQWVPRLLYNRAQSKLGDGTGVVQIKIDANQVGEIGKIIQRERARAGAPLLSDEGLNVAVEAAKAQSGQIDRPEVLYNFNIDV